MHIDLGYGQLFRGTPLEIVVQMKAVAEGVDDLDLGEYIDWIIERAASMEGVLFRVGSGPLHGRAEALLREMISARFATDLDADSEAQEEELPTARWVAAREVAAL